MLNLNKKQVSALLKIMSKDDSRPVLCTAIISEYKGDVVLAVTDGYQLTALKLDAEDAQPLLGKMVRRNSFEKWYKLATGKSRLTTQELVNIFNDDVASNGGEFEGNYPEWQKFIPTGETQDQQIMSFNPDFFKNVVDIYDSKGVVVKLYGKLSPMVVENEAGVSVVMPMKV